MIQIMSHVQRLVGHIQCWKQDQKYKTTSKTKTKTKTEAGLRPVLL